MSEKESLDLTSLVSLQLAPSWAKEPQNDKKHEKFQDSGFENRDRRGGGRDRRRDSRDGDRRGGDTRRDNRPGEVRHGRSENTNENHRDRGDRANKNQGDRRQGDRRVPSEGSGNRGNDRRGNRPEQRRGPMPPPIEGFHVSFVPQDAGVQYLAQQIRMSGRAYPIFNLARLILSSPERYHPRIERISEEESPPLFRVKLDGSVWLSEQEAMRHILENPELLSQLYEIETIEGEAPKGNFTSIAVCGFSGELLGPPNHHDYLPGLNRLFKERFSNMSFDRYKSRVRMEKDEELIEKWKAKTSNKTRYRPIEIDLENIDSYLASLQQAKTMEEAITEVPSSPASESSHQEAEESSGAPAETSSADAIGETVPQLDSAIENSDSPAVDAESKSEEGAPLEGAKKPKTTTFFENRSDLERHFQQTFFPRLVEAISTTDVPPKSDKQNLSPVLGALIRYESEKQRRFPMNTVQILCRQFEKTGLKFFKHDKKNTYVTVARPRPVPENIELSSSIERIVSFLKTNPDTNINALVAMMIEKQDRKGFAIPESTPAKSDAGSDEKSSDTKENQPAKVEFSAAEINFLQDLRWLTREGYVIHFDDGRLMLAPERHNPPPKKKKKTKEKLPSTTQLGSSPPSTALPKSSETSEAKANSSEQSEGQQESSDHDSSTPISSENLLQSVDSHLPEESTPQEPQEDTTPQLQAESQENAAGANPEAALPSSGNEKVNAEQNPSDEDTVDAPSSSPQTLSDPELIKAEPIADISSESGPRASNGAVEDGSESDDSSKSDFVPSETGMESMGGETEPSLEPEPSLDPDSPFVKIITVSEESDQNAPPTKSESH